jgi:hypothetical protein
VRAAHCDAVVAVDVAIVGDIVDASSVGMIEGLASMRTVLVVVDVRPFWSVARKWKGLLHFRQERGYGAKLAP